MRRTRSLRTRLALAAVAATALTPLTGVSATGAMQAAPTAGSDDTDRAQVAAAAPDGRARATLPTGRGFSFGSRLTGNAVLGSGRTALSVMCSATYPNSNSNEVAASQPTLADLADLGVVEATNRTHRINGRPAMTSRARIARASLLGGAVQLRGIESVARVIKNADGSYTGRSNATLLGLRIAGQPVPIPTGDEPQRFEIPGLGELAFNLGGTSKIPGGRQAFNLAVRLTLADGTKLQLARSQAKLSQSDVGIFRGGAWGTEVPTVLDLVKSGRTGFVPMPCKGTDGDTRDNDTAEVDVPGVLNVGATESTVRTREFRGGTANAVSRSTLAGISLGDGSLVIEAIKAKALVAKDARGRITKRIPTSQVLGITFDGETQTLPVDGQALEIPGVAKLETQVVTKTRRGLKVTALRVTLLDAAPDPIVVDLGNAAAYIVR